VPRRFARDFGAHAGRTLGPCQRPLAFRGGLRNTAVSRKPGAMDDATMSDSCLKSLQIGTDKRAIAIRTRDGREPGLFWLGGFKSDMQGSKAQALDAWAGR